MNLRRTVMVGGLAISVGLGGLTGCGTWNQGGDDGRTAGRRVDDKDITQRVEDRLKQEPVYKMSGVEVKTFRGVVQLSGFVDTQAQKQRAAEIAKSVPGTVEVVNQISIKPEPMQPTGRSEVIQREQPETQNDVDVPADTNKNETQ